MKKTLTLLHSNDLHGDFLAEKVDEKLTGGVSMLSGYVSKVRKEEKNVLYAISGDMFKGSLIDQEYRGISTIEIMNLLAPDVVTLGNHEVDYGLAHLLFLEKCAKFPIINANMFLTSNGIRLFNSHRIIEIDGMKIMFIGILTEDVLEYTRNEKLISTLVGIKDAAEEVGRICMAYQTVDIDLTVLLTHIGYENDQKLAAQLDPDWGVDLIIGGHTHTFMEEAEVVNGIPIVQAGTGSGQIGRFDIVYDTLRNKIARWSWRCDPVNENTAPTDPVMEQLLESYKSRTDAKYRRIVTSFARTLTHPSRTQETELGNLYADLLQWESSFDIMLMDSGAIRKKELGPIVEYQDMLENTPFDDVLWMLKVTGAQFKRMVMHILRDEAWEGHTEFYQFSAGVRIVYRRSTRTIEEFRFRGKDITDDQELLIALQNYHYQNFDEFLGIPLADAAKNMKPRVIATSVNNIVEEYFSTHAGLDAHVEGRLVVLE